MDIKYEVLQLESVESFIKGLPEKDRVKVTVAIESMKECDFGSVYIKQLKGDIKELIIKKYRIIFFVRRKTIYLVNAFIKKSQKTPYKIIEHAEKLFKSIS